MSQALGMMWTKAQDRFYEVPPEVLDNREVFLSCAREAICSPPRTGMMKTFGRAATRRASSQVELTMTGLTNLFADIPDVPPEELIQAILSTPGLRIERIVSLGHTSPEGFWYDQEDHEWVVLVKGAARLRCEGEEPIELGPGTFLNIPAHRRHRVEWTDPHEPTIWLAIHYGGGSS